MAPGYILLCGFFPLSIGISALKTGVLRYQGELSLKENPKLGYFLTWMIIVIGVVVIFSITIVILFVFSSRLYSYQQ
jgi:hypothetical protein